MKQKLKENVAVKLDREQLHRLPHGGSGQEVHRIKNI